MFLLGARGNLLPFMRHPVGYMSRLYRDYGEVVSLARGTTEYVFVFTPEYNQQVLGNTGLFHNLDARSSPLRIPPRSALARLFAGLTQMNGERHKQQRQLMAPALQKGRIRSYYDDVVAVTEKKLSAWRAGELRDLYQEMRELTLSVAVKTLVGLDPERGGDEMCRLLDLWTNLVFSASTMILPFDLPGFSYRRLLNRSEEVERIIRDLIERKRNGDGEHHDILSMLVHAHDESDSRLSDEELVGQTNFLFMAGHATTASALTWTLFLLSQHPRVMSELLDECKDELKGELPTMDQLDGLRLLEAVIKETMRLVPPVLWWSRISAAPTRLENYELPAGARVINSAYVTHRIAAVYPEPDRFFPARWFACHPSPYEYIPFSAGPRMCLGSTFALIEMKLVLAAVLQRFRLSLPHGTKIDLGGLMLSAPKPGMPVRIHLQDRKIEKSQVRGNIRRVVNLN